MTKEHLELRDRLALYTPDEAVAFPFSERLARDNGWSLPYARRVIHEYKRFAFLSVAAGHPVTPSDEVDQAWHLHMLYTWSYWKDFCGEVLGHRRSESWREFCRTRRSTECRPRNALRQFGRHRGAAIGDLGVRRHHVSPDITTL